MEKDGLLVGNKKKKVIGIESILLNDKHDYIGKKVYDKLIIASCRGHRQAKEAAEKSIQTGEMPPVAVEKKNRKYELFIPSSTPSVTPNSPKKISGLAPF